MKYDAIVAGSGHNGLIAAARLGQFGLPVGRPLTTVALGGRAPVRISGGTVMGADAETAAAYAALHVRLVRQAGALAPLMTKSRDKPAHHIYVFYKGKKGVGFGPLALGSPTLKRNIAYAWGDAPYCHEGRDLSVEIYLQRELIWQRRMERATIVDRALFKNPRRTATPPAEN